MQRIKKGDEVVITAGREKGRRGTVLRVTDDQRVFVEGVNMVKKHVKPNPMKGLPGGIQEKEAPVHLSNVMLYNEQAGKGDRVGFKTLEDGRKVRFFKSTGEVVDV
jgi:large subunit ribosomal protein L24